MKVKILSGSRLPQPTTLDLLEPGPLLYNEVMLACWTGEARLRPGWTELASTLESLLVPQDSTVSPYTRHGKQVDPALVVRLSTSGQLTGSSKKHYSRKVECVQKCIAQLFLIPSQDVGGLYGGVPAAPAGRPGLLPARPHHHRHRHPPPGPAERLYWLAGHSLTLIT